MFVFVLKDFVVFNGIFEVFEGLYDIIELGIEWIIVVINGLRNSNVLDVNDSEGIKFVVVKVLVRDM